MRIAYADMGTGCVEAWREPFGYYAELKVGNYFYLYADEVGAGETSLCLFRNTQTQDEDDCGPFVSCSRRYDPMNLEWCCAAEDTPQELRPVLLLLREAVERVAAI